MSLEVEIPNWIMTDTHGFSEIAALVQENPQQKFIKTALKTNVLLIWLKMLPSTFSGFCKNSKSSYFW